jgi:hypothetical protein
VREQLLVLSNPDHLIWFRSIHDAPVELGRAYVLCTAHHLRYCVDALSTIKRLHCELCGLLAAWQSRSCVVGLHATRRVSRLRFVIRRWYVQKSLVGLDGWQ